MKYMTNTIRAQQNWAVAWCKLLLPTPRVSQTF